MAETISRQSSSLYAEDDIIRIELDQHKKDIKNYNNIKRALALKAKEAKQACAAADTAIIAAMRDDRLIDGEYQRRRVAKQNGKLSRTLVKVWERILDPAMINKQIEFLETLVQKDENDSEVNGTAAGEDVFISSIEKMAKAGKEGILDLQTRFPGFFEALEQKAEQT
ncbi:hypothetical protein ACHAPU_010793 [Fusarium lateritium]